MPTQNAPPGAGAYDFTSLTAVLMETGVGAILPTTIIGENRSFEIKIAWNVSGGWVPFLAGNWKATASVESIGPGLEAVVGSVTVALTPGGSAYNGIINVPAGLPVAAGQSSTPYSLVVTLTAADSGGSPLPFAGYVEEPIVQVFKPGP